MIYEGKGPPDYVAHVLAHAGTVNTLTMEINMDEHLREAGAYS